MNILLTAAGTMNINDLTFTGGRKSAGANAAALEFNNSGPSAGAADGSSLIFSNASAALNLTGCTLRSNAVEHVFEVGNTPFNITNCTISNNTGTGAGVFIFGGVPSGLITSSTIANNNQGIWHANSGGTSTVTIKNTLLSQNGNINLRRTGGSGANNAITSNGYNLIDDNSFSQLTAPTATDLYGSSFNPQLGALADNGGPTSTRALMSSSAAIDKGGPGTSTDQRGFTRPLDDPNVAPASGGNNSDIGAYEVQTALGNYPAATLLLGGSGTVTPNFAPATNCTISGIVASAPSFTGVFSGNTSTGVITVTNAGPVGAFTVTVTATNACGESTSKTFTLIVTNTATWDGSADGDWNTAANWTPAGVPGAINNVVIPASGVSFEPSLSTAPATVNNLTIAAGRTLTLNGQDLTINGVLTLNGGTINAGTNTLNLTAAATVSRTGGQVTGNLKKTFSGAGSFTYPVGTINGYSPLDVTVTAGAGDLTVKAMQGPQPIIDASQSLQRYWSLSGTGITVNLVFHYLDPTDIPAGGSDATYRIIRVSGSTATTFPNDCAGGSPCVDPTANTARINGVTSFSDWTIGAATAPTAIDLATFNATGYDGGTYLEWQTGFEADNLGFRLYRDESGKRVLVNPQVIAGSALVAGSVAMRAGRSYAFWDDAPASNAAVSYWLEAIDLNGQSTFHGPFFARQIAGAPPAHSDAESLSRLGNSPSSLTLPLERRALPKRVAAGQVGLPSSLAAQPAVKISVKREGWYNASASELFAAGLDANADPRMLQLYVDGQPLPINVSSDAQGRLAAIEFYGRGMDAAYTDARVYWLVVGTQPGLRVPQVKAEGFATAARSFFATVERKERTIYFSALRNGERENFFGAVIAGNPVEQTLTLQHVDQATSGQAELEVALQGVTMQLHRVWAYVNGTFAGELLFNGQSASVMKFAFSHALLREGDNQVQLVAQGGASDVSLVDYLRLGYWHRFTADENALRLTISGKQAVSIDGFTSSAIRVFDVSNPDAISELVGKVEPQKSGYGVTVASPENGERQLLAITDAQAARPARLVANQPSSLRTTAHAADLVIITTRDLLAAFEPLKLWRAQQGVKAEIVDVEDLYDEFSYGSKSVQAIKDFLSYAATNWKTKPRYALFGGKASYDPKNYLGCGETDLVPTKLIDTVLMEAASDDWLADFDGDGVAELAVGRLPVRTAEEARAMVAKLMAYDQSAPAESLLLVADENAGFDFASASRQLGGLVPTNLRVEQINRGELEAATAKAELLAAINRGQKLINYAGHGSVNQWRGDLLTNGDAQAMTNGDHLAVFVMMTCLNGYFDDPALNSLGEALMKAEKGGAVAVWASSGMTGPDEQALMNQQLYRLLFASPSLSLGEAVRRAKSAINDSDARRTWILLGDPAMRLR